MTEYAELKTAFVMRLYNWATSPGSASEISGRQLAELIGDITGHSTANAIRQELGRGGYLRQTRTISDENDGWYEVLPAFFSFAEKLRAAPLPEERSGSFKNFRERLLVELAQKDHADGPNFYDLKQLADEASLQYIEGWVSKAAYFFRDHGLIQEAFSFGGGADGNLDARLTAEGLEAAEEIGFDVSAQSSNTMETVRDEIELPASDRTVRLDHNSSDYKEAVSALEKVISEFRKDHRLDNELGAEKSALLKALEAGREYLDDTQVRVRTAVLLTVDPLKIIAEKYEGQLIGAVATTALAILAKIFGLL